MNEFDALGFWNEAPQYKHYAHMADLFRRDFVVDFHTHFIVTRCRRMDDGAWYPYRDAMIITDPRFYLNLWSY